MLVRGGYYDKGKFKFKIQIPNKYPHDKVRVYFTSPIYHPLINQENGELDLKLCQESQYQLMQILIFIKDIFIESKYLEKMNSFNPDAGVKYSSVIFMLIFSRFNSEIAFFKIKAEVSVRETRGFGLIDGHDVFHVKFVNYLFNKL